MELWIARDDYATKNLWMYNTEPIKNKTSFSCSNGGVLFEIDKDLFPEVTFENSPQKVELKLVEQCI